MNSSEQTEYTTEDAVNGMWQSLRDDELRGLTPQQFYAGIGDLALSSEDAEEAWDEFSDRRDRVFA